LAGFQPSIIGRFRVSTEDVEAVPSLPVATCVATGATWATPERHQAIYAL